jgi:hypothetical protein
MPVASQHLAAGRTLAHPSQHFVFFTTQRHNSLRIAFRDPLMGRVKSELQVKRGARRQALILLQSGEAENIRSASLLSTEEERGDESNFAV